MPANFDARQLEVHQQVRVRAASEGASTLQGHVRKHNHAVNGRCSAGREQIET
jgi:hypothetical protein